MEVNNDVNLILLSQFGNTKSVSNITTNAISTIFKNEYSTNPIGNSVLDSVELSAAAIDNYYEMREENTVWGLDLIQTTSDALDEMKSNLSFLHQVLNDSESYGDEQGLLAWLEEQSNLIIDKILDIYSQTEYNGVKLFTGIQEYSSSTMLHNYQNFVLPVGTMDNNTAQLIINTQLNLEGLPDLKALSIYDNDYETKLKDVLKNINQKSEELTNKKQYLETIAHIFYDESESVLANDTVSSADIQKQIVKNATSVINSVIGDISTEKVLPLIYRYD